MKSDFELQNSYAYWIYRLNNRLQEQFNQLLKSYDITWPQWMLLNVLASEQADTPAGFADHLGVDRSSITRLLDRLEQKHYVERQHDKLDRRSVKILMTKKGIDTMDSINALAYQHQQEFLDELHLSERRGFKKELQKILKTTGIETLTTWTRID
jgi:DNA-binding MarR family transcriptional regulator